MIMRWSGKPSAWLHAVALGNSLCSDGSCSFWMSDLGFSVLPTRASRDFTDVPDLGITKAPSVMHAGTTC